MLSTVLRKKLGINKCNLYFGELPERIQPLSVGRSETCRGRQSWLMIAMQARTKVMFLSTIFGLSTTSAFTRVRRLRNSILVCKQNLNFCPRRHGWDTLWRHSILPLFAVVPSCRLNENMTSVNLLRLCDFVGGLCFILRALSPTSNTCLLNYQLCYSQNISILVVLMYSWQISVNMKKYQSLGDVYYGECEIRRCTKERN